ncbi:MAG: DUF1294 domain-containing protein [Planctomycetes bacterium]|nr:DUF1294 domain-containing protein [Planctomycetota bacterium]
MARRRRSPGWEYTAGGILAAALVAAGLGFGAGLSWFIAALAGLNAATFALYGYDKHCAIAKKFRVPEAVLHFFALAGGSPGALLGQQVFRHKRRKGSFLAVYWLIVILQAAVVAYILWPRG